MSRRDQNAEELRIVLVGDSGSGKSATGNTILGKRAFTARQSQNPETLTCQAERGEFEGRPMVVVDTPSTLLMNTIDLSKCISYCASSVHALLLVISLNQFADVERYLKNLQWLFGEEVSHYTIVLFTGGDELAEGVTKEEFIDQNPVPFEVEYHVFINRSKDPSQVRELLEKINTMVQRNGGRFFIKIKDWKQKYLYPFTSAVTIGGSFGAASGGTGGGVLLAAAGSTVGLLTGHIGGNRSVAVAMAIAVTVGLAIAIGADVYTGAEFVLKVGAAIATGAGADRVAVKAYGKLLSIAVFGCIGGAVVGAGIAVAVEEYAAMSVLDLLFAGLAVIYGVEMILVPFFSMGSFPKIVRFYVFAGVSAGAVLGATTAVLGVSGFAAGTFFTGVCHAVTWWLNSKA